MAYVTVKQLDDFLNEIKDPAKKQEAYDRVKAKNIIEGVNDHGIGGAVGQKKYAPEPEHSKFYQFVKAEMQTPIPGAKEIKSLPGEIEKAAGMTSPKAALMRGVFDFIPDTAAEATVQAASGPLMETAGLALKPLAKPLAKGAGALGDYLATSPIFGGIGKASWEWFKNNAGEVMSQIKQGLGPEAADTIANDLRTSISNAATQMEDTYKAGVIKLEQSRSPIRMNLQKNIGDNLLKIAQDAGYTDPKRNAASQQARFFSKNILSRVNDMRAASPLDIYYLQKDLNAYIKDHIGTSLGIDLLQAKDVIRKFIEETPRLNIIADMNAAWSAAKDVDVLAKKTTGSNDLIRSIQNVFNNPRETLRRRSLERLSELVPEAGKDISRARSLQAAESVAPLMRGFPATGYGAGAMFAAGKYGLAAASNPFLIAAAPTAALFSPRAYGYGYQNITKAAEMLGEASVMPYANGVAQATIAALRAARLKILQDQNVQP